MTAKRKARRKARAIGPVLTADEAARLVGLWDRYHDHIGELDLAVGSEARATLALDLGYLLAIALRFAPRAAVLGGEAPS